MTLPTAPVPTMRTVIALCSMRSYDEFHATVFTARGSTGEANNPGDSPYPRYLVHGDLGWLCRLVSTDVVRPR
jgi:hypothetical protein